MVQEKIVSSEKTNKDEGIHQEKLILPELRFPEFKDNWTNHKLGEISKIQRGASPRPISDKKWYDTENKTVGWVRIGDVTNSFKFLDETEDYFSEEGIKKSRFIPKGSLIMSICATIGKPIITNMDVCIHDGFIGFSELKGINEEFLYYNLNILENKFCSLGQTGSQANLNSDLVRDTKINIPSIKEQEKIVDFLSKIDKKIELLEKKHSEYNQFFDFILNKIFEQELVFDNKTRWKEVTLNDLGTFYRGHSYNSSNVVEQGLVVLRSNNIQNNRLIFDDSQLQHVNKDCKNEIKLRKGDIVICMSNGTKSLVGKSAVYEGNYENNLTVGAFCSIFRSANPLSKYLLRTTQYKKNLHIILAGTNINNLKNEDIKKFKFKIPKDNEDIEKIGVFLGQLELKQNILNQELFNIKNFKKALLQKMFI